jgi:NAD(P)-dependent dehydrogenase (short-subunit alcohol dehydrogenase family)
MGYLDGRVVLITGAGRGIGAAVARALAAAGASVVVNDLGVHLDGTGPDSGAAQTVAAEIRAAGGSAVADTGDVSDFTAASDMVQRAVDEFGRLDVLVNVAGIVRDRMIFNMTEDEWDAVVRVHLRGTFNTTRHAASYWRSNRGGEYRLINFTSGAGLFGSPGQPNYAAAKLGIVGLTLSCSNSLRRYGVTSNAISPTAATRMTQSIPDSVAEGMGRPELDQMAPEQVAPPVIYLASDKSGWLNGRVIGARGRRITLYSGFEVNREIVSLGGIWDVDEVFSEFEGTFRPAVEHRGRFDALAE